MNKYHPMILICLLIVSYVNVAFAYDNIYSHPQFSGHAVESSILETTDFLKDIGYDDNYNHNLNIIKIKDWVRLGAKLEDAGSKADALFGRARFNNHFHDPLKDWSEAGLSDLQSGMSMVLWAQDSFKQQSALEGDWSWRKIRKSYMDALTAKTETEREAAFADTFRGLGHQMHLIQDAGQPDHVRNDAHPADGLGLRLHVGFEKWVERQRGDIRRDFLSKGSPSENAPKFPALNLNIPQANGLVPITRLVDANLYTGTVPTAGTSQGLAEYASSNFFSDDTIFAAERFSPGDEHYFPYPKASSTNLREYTEGTIVPEKMTAPDGTDEYSVWIKKEWDGDIVNHIVRPSFFSRAVLGLLGEGELFYLTFYRDEVCHQDYVQKLIPRAVGYSAALINYFFRGQLEMEADPSNSSQYIIKNESDEEMSGMFSLYYDDTSGNRHLVPGAEWPLGISAKGTSNSVNFTAPSDAKESGKYMLLFKGRLGQEDGAVVGKSVELGKSIYGRMVIIYNRYEPFIKVVTEKGIIDTELPSQNFHSCWAVRFDVANPDEFGILAYYSYPKRGTYYEYHLFQIDNNASSVKYLGKSGDYLIHKHSNEPNRLCTGWAMDDYNGESCTRRVYVADKYVEQNVVFSDFFLKNRVVTPFGSYNNFENNFIHEGLERTAWTNNVCNTNIIIDTCCESGESGINLSGLEEEGIYYGNLSLNAKNTWEGGFFNTTPDCGTVDMKGVEITNKLKYFPHVVLNQSDSIFSTRNYDQAGYAVDSTLESTIGIQLPQDRDVAAKIVSMPREDGKYSFFLSPLSRSDLPGVSYSSEIGKVNCSGFLIGENKVGWRIKPWSTEIVQFESCDHWQKIYSLPVKLGYDYDYALFDLKLFEK